MLICLAMPQVDLLRNRFEHIFKMPMLTQTYPADSDLSSSEGVVIMLTWTHPALLPNCSPFLSQTCSVNVSFGCHNLVYMKNSTWWPSQPSRPSNASKLLSMRYPQDEASFTLLNGPPLSVGCSDPGWVRNASGTLHPGSYEGSKLTFIVW